jgi:hypothetical protein
MKEEKVVSVSNSEVYLFGEGKMIIIGTSSISVVLCSSKKEEKRKEL